MTRISLALLALLALATSGCAVPPDATVKPQPPQAAATDTGQEAAAPDTSAKPQSARTGTADIRPETAAVPATAEPQSVRAMAGLATSTWSVACR